MLLDRIITQIHFILDTGNAGFEARSIATEYVKFVTQAANRIEQCISLIHSGNDYAALQIAETNPPLLDVIAKLSFARQSEWIEFCRNYDFPIAPVISQIKINSINSLYEKGISETHPLYRDYRRAIRERNNLQALSVLLSIIRINNSDSNAINEYYRLSKKVTETELTDIVKQIKENGDSSEILKRMELLEALCSQNLLNNQQWSFALMYREKVYRDTIYQESRTEIRRAEAFQKQNDYYSCAECIGRCQSNQKIYHLEWEKEEEIKLKELENWATHKIKVDTENKAKNQYIAEIRATLSETIAMTNLSASTAKLRLQYKHLKRTLEAIKGLEADFANDELLLSAKDLENALQTTLQNRKKKMIGLTVTISCIILIFFGGGTYFIKEEIALKQIITRLNIEITNGDEPGVQSTIKTFKEQHPLLSGRESFLDVVQNAEESFKKEHTITAAFRIRLDNFEKALNSKIQFKDIKVLQKEAAEIEILANTLKHPFQGEQVKRAWILFEVLKERKKLFSEKTLVTFRDDLKKVSEASEELTHDKTIGEIKNTLDEIESSFEYLNDFVKSPEYNLITADLKAEWEKTNSRVSHFIEIIQKNKEIKDSLFIADDFNSYADAIQKLSGLGLNLDKTISSARKITANLHTLKTPELAFFSPTALKMWQTEQVISKQETRFLPTPQNIKEREIAEHLTEHENFKFIWKSRLTSGNAISPKIVFTLGEPESLNQQYGTTKEIIQHVKIIGLDGSEKDHEYSQKTFEGQGPRGGILKNSMPTEEGIFYNTFAEIYDHKKGQIKTPVIMALDLIRSEKNLSPEFIAYLHQELLKIGEQRIIEWGFPLSPTLQKDAEYLQSISRNLISPFDWLGDSNSKRKRALINNLQKLYGSKSAPISKVSYYKEAEFYLNFMAALNKQRFQYAGFINESIKIPQKEGEEMTTPPSNKFLVKKIPEFAHLIFGINENGDFGILFEYIAETNTFKELQKPRNLSPLFFHAANAKLEADSIIRPKNFTMPAPIWEGFLFNLKTEK